jgi:flagellar hook-basal body complex protein FliE
MSMPITPVGAPALPRIESPAQAAGKPGEFRSLLESSISQVENLRSDAGQAVENLIAGQGGELHTVVLATQKAELAFELGLQVRNKVVQAYQEIMRMQM